MTDNKQTVLTDEQNAIIAARFPDDPANACRAQSAIVEILSKLRAPVAQQDLWAVAESVVVEWQKAGKMPPMAWDFREFLIAGMRAYALAAEGSEKGVGDVGECSFSDLIDTYTDAVRNGNFSERVAARAELMNSYRQQRGGDVTLRRGIEQWTASDPSSMSKQSPEAIYYALDDARSDILTLCREVQRLSAALAAQPAASAEPSKEECWDIWQIATRAEGFLDDRIHSFACDLLNRYGRPAGDAERYRWLREHGFNHADVELTSDLDGNPITIWRLRFYIPEPSGLPYEEDDWTLEQLDAAIDHARRAEERK